MLKLLPYTLSPTKKASIPLYLIHFVTNKCNARCPHCFAFTADGAPTIAGQDLSLDEITRMTQSLGKQLCNVNLTGGETFLRSDIIQICEAYLHNTGVQVIQLFTNGWFTKRTTDCMQYLARKYSDRNFVVSIPIDDLHDAHNDFRQLKDGFNKAMTTYERLRDLSLPNIDLDIGLTVNHRNQDHLDQIYDYLVRERKFRTLSCTIVRGDPADATTKDVGLEKYEQFVERINEGMRTNELDCFKGFAGADLLNAKSIVMRRDVIPKVRTEGFQSNCYAGRLIGVVYANGDVYPCEILDKKIGNVKDYDYSLPALWKSQQAEEIRDWIWQSRCHCEHECFMTVNLLFNIYYPKIISEFTKIKIGLLSNKGTPAIVA